MHALSKMNAFCQGEKKIDRFVDPNVRGVQRQLYSNIPIFRNLNMFFDLKYTK